MKACFCGNTDSKGQVIFDAAYCGLDAATRADWLAVKAASGMTHMVLSVVYSYYNWYQPFNLLGLPDQFLIYVNELLTAGITPIVFCTDGSQESYQAAVPPGGQWDTFLPAMTAAGIRDQCLWVPGWEPVKGGWSSNQFSTAITRQYALLGGTPLVYAHLSTTRGSFASNPVEGDDPWAGNEIACWTSNGGENLTGLLYQTPTGQDLFGPGYQWFDRWYEIMARLGIGGITWKKVDVVFFEYGAYDFIRGNATQAQVQAIRSYAAGLGYAGYGNG